MSVLAVINEELTGIGIPYEFMQYTAPVKGAYVVGEYSEVESMTEEGHKTTSMVLTATTRGTWLELEEIRSKIERHFPSVCGLRRSTSTGAVAIFYKNSFPVPTGEAELKRIQINLDVEEWKGMI